MAADKGHLDVVRALLASGAQPAQSPNALALAADKGHLNVVQALLASGAQPDQSPNALALATGKGHLDVVRALTTFIPAARQAPSLQSGCRASIRSRLVENLNAGGSPVKTAIDSLPLPSAMRSYLYQPLPL